MDRAAGAEQGHRAVLARELVHQVAPLRGAIPVARVRGGHDQVAVRLGQRVHVAHAARRRRRHGLLEQLHPGLEAPGADLGQPQQAQRVESRGRCCPTSRAIAMAPARVGRLLVQALGVPRALDRDPPLALALGVRDRPLGAREPAARRRRPPGQQVLVRHPDAHARALVAAAGLDVCLERALASGDPVLDVARGRTARARCRRSASGVSLLVERGLEGVAGRSPLSRLEEAQSLGALHCGHPPTLAQGRRGAKRYYIPGRARKPSTSGVCSHSSSVSDRTIIPIDPNPTSETARPGEGQELALGHPADGEQDRSRRQTQRPRRLDRPCPVEAEGEDHDDRP